MAKKKKPTKPKRKAKPQVKPMHLVPITEKTALFGVRYGRIELIPPKQGVHTQTSAIWVIQKAAKCDAEEATRFYVRHENRLRDRAAQSVTPAQVLAAALQAMKD